MSRATLNLLATSSLSPFAATRSFCAVHRRAAIPFRTYSETASEKADETPQDSRNAEQKEKDISEPAPPLLELQAKLKTKEDEVLDLTVRLSFPNYPMHFLTCNKLRIGYDISKPTS
jgi:hypothetical protein